jgi:nitroreductase
VTDFIDVIYKRRSIRKFTKEPVDKEVLTTLVKAGMAAPTAMNAQPWEFLIITAPDTLARFRKALMFAKMEAPAAICVLGSNRGIKNFTGDRFWVQDCSAATENILLAAVSMGLGGVWIGVHPVKIFERQVKNILNLPAGLTPLNLIYVGHPAEVKPARSQYDEKKVHWEAFPKSGWKQPTTKIEEETLGGTDGISNL